MCACIITGRRVLRRSTYLSCACQNVNYWDCLVRLIILPSVYAHLLSRLVSSHLVHLFLKLFHTLDICLRWIFIHVRTGHSLKGSASFFRVFLLSQCLRHFWRGFQSCRRIFLIVTARSVLSVLSNLLRGLRSCFYVFDHLTARLSALLWNLAHPVVPNFPGGSLKFSKGLICKCKRHPRKSAPLLLFNSSRYAGIFDGLLTLSPTGFIV